MTNIVAVTEITNEIVEAFQRLIPQLSLSSLPPSWESLAAIVASPATTLLVASVEPQGMIVGSLTLVIVRIPTGLRVWIEDVVVDAGARGQGIGEALCREAIQHAKHAGATTIDLTTRPSRTAANRLYQRLGFVLRETNVYRYTIE